MVKIIAFDMWQTLGTYEFDLYEEVLRVSGLDMPLGEFTRIKSETQVDDSLDDKTRFVEKIKKMGVNDEEILKKVENLYVTAHDSIFLYEDTIEGLSALKKMGKILVLITNVDRYAHEKIMSLFPEDFFEFILASFEVGIRKPNKQLFSKVTEKYTAKSQEILMVGDSEYMDIMPAKELGWKTVFINRSGKVSESADYSISNLNEIKNIV